jgi:hypothetical protein
MGALQGSGAFAAKRFCSQGLASIDDFLECTLPEECTACFIWHIWAFALVRRLIIE